MEQHAAFVEDLLKAAKSVTKGKAGEQLASLLPHYWSLLSHEDLEEKPASHFVETCARHLKLAESRKPGVAKISVNHCDADNCNIEIVTDDMPFLFDSVSNALHRMAYSINLASHPVVWSKRSKAGKLQSISNEAAEKEALDTRAEAMIHFEVCNGDGKTPKQLESAISEVLKEVAIVVENWQTMRSKAAEIRFGLEQPYLPLDEDERRQACAFLEWIEDNNFTFISYSKAKLVKKAGCPDLKPISKNRLGLDIDASPWATLAENACDKLELQEYIDSPSLLVITKANRISPIHRPSYLDYIAIKDYDKQGNMIGEHRFFGLFTRSAYNSRALDIPLLKTRIQQAQSRATFAKGSHNAKMLLQILETFPRDEQFQSTVDELYSTALGVLSIDERNRVRVFCRNDPFHRFYSLLVYLPRERYSQQVREMVQELVAERCDADEMEFDIQFSQSTLARLQLIVRPRSGQTVNLDVRQLEQDIEALTRNWEDSLQTELRLQYRRSEADKLRGKYQDAFGPAYKAKTSSLIAAMDIAELEALDGQRFRTRLLVDPGNNTLAQVRCYFSEAPMDLADAQPMLANLGLRLRVEDLYPLTLPDGSQRWVQDFRASAKFALDADDHDAHHRFEQAFVNIYHGIAEDDWFNALVLAADLDWRQTGLLRAYSRYLKQLGIRFGQIYISETMAGQADIARQLVKLFEARFDPAQKNRESAQANIDKALLRSLDEVTSLDADRILRSIRNLIMATLRCNYYQTDENGEHRSTFAFKLSPRDIPEAPQPRPVFEIWVHSPRMEAVHLRGGKVARGGLRWSDRPEDFRTEVLGLVKAQIVKNAVIVPVGAKGGFVCRKLPSEGGREATQAEVVACYRLFMRSMISLTDNLDGDKILRPDKTVRHDEDDPYLVVAADKGTATFSDIANEEAVEAGFWVGDAFASGGSNGYDHKKMGITAKGAWESVKRHFRELGKDIQNDDFTAIGIGDMAGDVFGNGMLLSKHTRLLAAFNHLHIFIDPNPDAAKSWTERERLFKLPRSSWTDYDEKLISKGGGIFERSQKSIKPSAEACEALGLKSRSYSPDELIHEILKAPVDLFWNGGIGTYVKASSESHEKVGDRANDSLRVNGDELQCLVVGEGGNLGLTQLGRVEYSLNGGHCNTDFIDNAGGVDSSDQEVNIKILLNAAMQNSKLDMPARNKLLKSMTSDVENKVLRNNYLQSQAISTMATSAGDRIGEQAELIRILERDAGLDRKLEFLPDEKTIEQRQSAGQGLTRPELSVLLSYSKIDLFNELLNSDVPEDEYLATEIRAYFPERLSKDYEAEIKSHRLRREIISTRITNSLVNRMGAAFAHRMNEELGVPLSDIARAYTVARDAFEVRPLWDAVEALDNTVPARMQLDMMLETQRLIKHATLWLVQSGDTICDIAATVEQLRNDVYTVEKLLPEIGSSDDIDRHERRMKAYQGAGVPEAQAKRITALRMFYPVPDINWLAKQSGISSEKVTRVYFYLANRIDLAWVRRQIEQLKAESRWQAMARNALRDDLYLRQRSLTGKVLAELKPRSALEPQLEQWFESVEGPIGYLQNLIAELKTNDSADYLSLSVVLRQLGKLAL